MKDIGLFLQEDGTIDIEIVDGDLRGDETLETSALISMFTDQRITDDELPDGQISKRGWWGDMFTKIDGDQIGSKVWLFERNTITNSHLAQIEDKVVQGFDWMLKDGVAQSVACTAVRNGTYTVKISVSIKRPDGTDDKFSAIWDTQAQRVA